MALKEYRVLLHGRTETTAMYTDDDAHKLGLTEDDLVSSIPLGRSSRGNRSVRPSRSNGSAAANKAAAAKADKVAAAKADKSVAAKAKEAAGLDVTEDDDPDDEDLDNDQADEDADGDGNDADPSGRGF